MGATSQQHDRPASPPGMRDRTARGFVWMMLRAAATKFATLAAQIVLAWLLLEEDFGLFAMATTIHVFAFLVEWMGTRDVLVRRGRRIEAWLYPALGMTMGMGLLSSGIMAALAPLAAWAYGEPQVAYLVLILAIRPPLQAVSIPAFAYLQTQMHFRSLALIGSVQAFTQAGLSIVLALLGFGPYSFVIPIPIAYGMQSLVLWITARPPIQWRRRHARWRHLLGDTFTLTTGNLTLQALVTRGDYLMLGLFQGKTVLGVYYFGYVLSAQALQLMTLSLTQVLMPAISTLRHEPRRQLRGFLIACEALIAVGLPLCLLNAAIAEPAFRLLFSSRWDAAIPVFQILCLGLAMRMVDGASYAMLKGTGRFGAFLKMSLVASVLFIIPVTAAAAWGDLIAVAWTVTLWSVAYGPIAVYVSIRSMGGTWRQVVGVFAAPMLIAPPAVAAGYFLASRTPAEMPGRELVQIAINVIVSGLVYAVLLRFAAPGAWASLRQAIDRLRSRRRRADRAPRSESAILDDAERLSDNSRQEQM